MKTTVIKIMWLDKYIGYINIFKMKKKCRIVLKLILNGEMVYICTVCACSVIQSCLTLCNPMDCSPPGSSVRGIP